MYPGTQQGETVQGYVLKCPKCGAPLDVSPDDVITVCKYCGEVISIRQGINDARIVQSLPKSDVESRIYKELRRRGISPTPLKSTIIYLPFFLYKAKVDAIIVKEFKDRNGRTYAQEFDYTREVPATVYARYSEFEGLDVIMDAVEKNIDKKRVKIGTVNPEDAKFVKILGPQKTEDDASKEARERAEFNATPLRVTGAVGALVSSVVGVVFYDAKRVDLTYNGFYFYPVFFYRWREGRRIYLTIGDAATGEVLYTKIPVSETLRNIGLGAVVLSPLLLAGLPIAGLGLGVSILASLGVGLGGAMLAIRGDMTWKKMSL